MTYVPGPGYPGPEENPYAPSGPPPPRPDGQGGWPQPTPYVPQPHQQPQPQQQPQPPAQPPEQNPNWGSAPPAEPAQNWGGQQPVAEPIPAWGPSPRPDQPAGMPGSPVGPPVEQYPPHAQFPPARPSSGPPAQPSSAPPLPGPPDPARTRELRRFARLAWVSVILAVLAIAMNYAVVYLFPMLGLVKGKWQLDLQTNMSTTLSLSVLAGTLTYLIVMKWGRLPAGVNALLVAVGTTVVVGGLPIWLTATKVTVFGAVVVSVSILVSTFIAGLLAQVQPRLVASGGFLAAALDSALSVLLSTILGLLVVPALTKNFKFTPDSAISLGALINFGYSVVAVLIAVLVVTFLMRSTVDGKVGRGIAIGVFPAAIRIISAGVAGILTAVFAVVNSSSEAFLTVATAASVAGVTALIGAGAAALVIAPDREREYY